MIKTEKINYVAPDFKTVIIEIQGVLCVSPNLTPGNGPWGGDETTW